jgi:hypothetical protein
MLIHLERLYVKRERVFAEIGGSFGTFSAFQRLYYGRQDFRANEKRGKLEANAHG